MNEQHVIELLEILDLKRIKSNGTWVSASCPFAPAKHSKGSDSSPSFGVSVHPGKGSHYNCFSCNSHGPLSYLPTALASHFKGDYSQARFHIINNEMISLEPYEDGVGEENGFEIDFAPEIPEVVSDKFSPVKPWMYEDRGITKQTAKKFQFSYDSYEERLVIPIRDADNRLVGLRGRYLGSEKSIVKYRAYTELSPSGSDPKRFGVWFGDHLPLDKKKVLVLVEGELDLILLWQSKAVTNIRSSMGCQITKQQIRRISDLNMPILFFLDNDPAGESAVKKLSDALRGMVPLYRVRDYFGCKDPADLVVANKISQALKRVDKL